MAHGILQSLFQIALATTQWFQCRWVFIANPYQRIRRNFYILFLLIHKSKIIFLGVLSVPMQKLFTSEENYGYGV